MTYDQDRLRDLIPLYLNGTLSEKERGEFEAGLDNHPEVQRELEEFSEIKGLYDSARHDIPQPSDIIYHRITKAIEADKRTAEKADKGHFLEGVRNFFEETFASPRVSWSVVAIQCALIMFLVVTLPRQDQFTTLTSPPIETGKGIVLNIVFDPEAREVEIRNILHQFKAHIIYGPTPKGLYAVQFKSDSDIEVLLEDLKRKGAVKFAEPRL